MSTVRAPNDSFWLKSAKLKENREKLQNAVYSGQKDGVFFGIDKKLENFIGVVENFGKFLKPPEKSGGVHSLSTQQTCSGTNYLRHD